MKQTKAPGTVGARFDRNYYDKHYESARTRVHGPKEIGALASGVAGLVAWYGSPLRSVLDVGAGPGLWRDWFRVNMPRVRYRSVELSGYACERYGHEQGDLVSLSGSERYDLVVLAMQEPQYRADGVRQEEIFADIYGCIVGGPVMGLSSQCTENEQPADWFIQKDRAYPFAVIRPYIYIQVLAQMGMAKASQALSKRWEGILKNERAIEADQLESEINKQLKAQWIAALSKGQTRDPAVEEIASQFAPTFQLAAFQSFVEQVLKHVLTGLQPVITKRWSEDIADGGAVETLFAQFETNLQDPNWPPQAVQEAAQRNSWQDFLVGRGYTVGRTIKAKTSEAKTSEVKLPEDWADQALADNAHGGGEWIKFTSDKWEAVVDLAGWATDGPVGKPHGVL